MRDKDLAAKDFMKNNDVFADAFNGYFFQGKKVLMPDALTSADTVSTIAHDSMECGTEFSERIRDILKSAVIYTDGKVRYVLLGIENQSTVDPWMVVRCLEYDARTYKWQVDALRRTKPRATESAAASDFQSKKESAKKLCPVVSLVIYFGPDKWNAPTTLHEMFDQTDEDPHPYAQFAFDYRMHLIEPYRMNDTDFNAFKSNLREVLKWMKAVGERVTLKKMLAQDERFKEMDCKAVALINACTDAKIKYNKTQRKVDMRNVFLEEREEGFAEGMEKGIEKGMEKGIEKGIEKGRAEGQNQEKLTIALRMLTEKLLDAPTIAKVTGLTLQQVQALQTAQ